MFGSTLKKGAIAPFSESRSSYFVQALPWSAWLPLAFASASVMYSPAFVLP